MSSSLESDALVLDTTDHGESDLIVVLFTRDSGRIAAIAKGAKKSKKRFVNKLEIFTFLHIHYQQKSQKNLAFLSEAELHTSFYNLRCNFELYGIASIIREFLLLGIKDGEPDMNVFRLSLWAFHQLDQKVHSRQILVLFLVRFYDYLGYRPDFQACASCHREVSPANRYHFNPGTGQLVCSCCHHSQTTGHLLSHGTIKLLQKAQDQPLERLHMLKISGSILKESLQLLHHYGRQIFQRDIHSWKVMGR